MSRVFEVRDETSNDLLVRIEQFEDKNLNSPTAYDDFLKRLARYDPVKEGFKTTVFDSSTFAEESGLLAAEKRWNPTAKNPMKWHAAVAKSLRHVFLNRFRSMEGNVLVLAHIHRISTATKDAEVEVNNMKVYPPAVPGDVLKSRVGGGFGEFYRAHVRQGNHVLQTKAAGRYAASTQIPAPDNCPNSYEELWKKPDKFTEVRSPIQAFVYGDPGSGKSVFAASFPKPIFVFGFDPKSKLTPYRKLGITKEIQS